MLLEGAPGVVAPVVVIPVGDGTEALAVDAVQSLRHAGIRAEIGYRGNLKRRMERANKQNARAAVIIGSEEAARGVAQVKNLTTGEQHEVALPDLAAHFA
jgi:histidyl-tRNA synthetase